MRTIVLTILIFISFSLFAQQNDTSNIQTNEIKNYRDDSITLYLKKYSPKNTFLPIRKLSFANKFIMSKGLYYTTHEKETPKKVRFHLGTLKPVFQKDSVALPIYQKARIYRITSTSLSVSSFILLGLAYNNQYRVSNGLKPPHKRTNFREFDYRTKLYFRGAILSVALSIVASELSRHYLNKATKTYNKREFAW